MSSRHSAGIGRPSSSRRNQSTTVSTSAFAPLNVTRIAFRTFAAASAATRFSKTAAYGFFDIHQTTRKRVLLGAARRFLVVKSVPLPSADESVDVDWTAIGSGEYPLSSSVCRVDKPRSGPRPGRFATKEAAYFVAVTMTASHGISIPFRVFHVRRFSRVFARIFFWTGGVFSLLGRSRRRPPPSRSKASARSLPTNTRGP